MLMQSNTAFKKEVRRDAADTRHLTRHQSDGGVTYGSCEMRGLRKTMEDRTVAVIQLPPPPPSGDSPRYNPHSLFGVFDGHLGHQAASYVSEHITGTVSERLDYCDGELDRREQVLHPLLDDEQ